VTLGSLALTSGVALAVTFSPASSILENADPDTSPTPTSPPTTNSCRVPSIEQIEKLGHSSFLSSLKLHVL
jgi:hypothetical protein